MAAELIYNGKDLADTISKSYSPFGEQLGEESSGFGYNGEYYNAATGLIYLRARFYAPEMNRFSQKDLLRGSIFAPKSLNRYLYCQNDPVDFADYNGRQMCAANAFGCGGGGGGKIQKTEETIRSLPYVKSSANVCTGLERSIRNQSAAIVQYDDGGARNTSPVAQSRPGMGAMSEYGRVPRKTITTDGPGVEGPTGGAYSCGIADDLNSLKRELKGDIKWVMEEVAKPTVKFIKQELEKADLTFSIGANISGSPSFWSFNGQYFVTVDCKGNVAIQYSAMGGVTTGSPSCSISLVTIITDAPDYKKIEGPSGQIGGSYATFVDWLPLFVGGDFMFIPDESNDEMYNGISANFGIGTPGQETHVEWGETHTIEGSEFNIFDEAKDFYYYIIEWCER